MITDADLKRQTGESLEVWEARCTASNKGTWREPDISAEERRRRFEWHLSWFK